MTKIVSYIAALLLLTSTLKGLNITELMYYPPATDPNIEFVELYNDTGTILDLSNWSFTKGITFVFPDNTYLEDHEYLVVCKNEIEVKAKYKIVNTIGNFGGNLNDSGETIACSDNNGVEMASVKYSMLGQWPNIPVATGHTLSLKNPFNDPAVPTNWTSSTTKWGTPGRANFPITGSTHLEPLIFIDVGDTWKYLRGNREFTYPIDKWRGLPCTECSTWTDATTGIGFGETYLSTDIGAGTLGLLSFAARKTFTVTSVDEVENLTLSIKYDDGFVAYLNGIEVARSLNMPISSPGIVTTLWNTVATSSHESNIEEKFVISKESMVVGTNVLAIQVHNVAQTSADLVLIPKLTGNKSVATVASSPLFINEVFTRSGAYTRWVEIYNSGSTPIQLGGYYMSDDPSVLTKKQLPSGTISAHGLKTFTEAQLSPLVLTTGVLRLFLTSPGQNVIDACQLNNPVPTSIPGASHSRYTDGAFEWGFAETPTMDTTNIIVTDKIVFNELMYDCFTSRRSREEDVDDRNSVGKYIELYNNGSTTVDMDGWKITEGLTYTFTAGTSMDPNTYLVIALDPTYIQTTYGITGVKGPWGGNLSGSGELIRLLDKKGNIVDSVLYSSGGKWADNSNGRGASLELIDPSQDNAYGGAWDACDLSQKAAWVELKCWITVPPGGIVGDSVIRFLPNETSEFLLDDVQLRFRGAGSNFISNGDFETDTLPWIIQGTLVRSVRTTVDKKVGNACLRVIASNPGDLRNNRLAIEIVPALTEGDYELKMWVRWQSGSNMFVVCGYDGAFSHVFYMPLPRDLGTPGRENSVTEALRTLHGSVNLGPIISNVTQDPVSPVGDQPVVITAQVTDSNGLQSVSIKYRLNTRIGEYETAVMTDDGESPDVWPGDNIWTGTVPGQSEWIEGSYTVVPFHINATDTQSQRRTFPVGYESGDVPHLSLLYMISGDFAHAHGYQVPLPKHRLIMDRNTKEELETRFVQEDEKVFGSVVFEDQDVNPEIYHGVTIHYHGSPHNRPRKPNSININYPVDNKMHRVKKSRINRNGAYVNEAAAYYMISKVGTTIKKSAAGRYNLIRWEIDGWDQGNLAESEAVDKDYVGPRYGEGPLYKVTSKFTYKIDNTWSMSGSSQFKWKGYDKENYRHNFSPEELVDEDDWTDLMQLMSVMDEEQTPDNDVFETKIQELIDVEQWFGLLAVRTMNDDWDALGVGNGQNSYFVHGTDGLWKLIPWDMDNTFGMLPVAITATTAPIADPGIRRLMERPRFRRIFLRAMKDTLQKVWNVSKLTPFLQSWNSKGSWNMGDILTFVKARTPIIEIAIGDPVEFSVVTTPGTDQIISRNNPAVIKGTAPLELSTLTVNGESFTDLVSWVTPTSWQLKYPNPLGQTQELTFVANDRNNSEIAESIVHLVSFVGVAAPVIFSVLPSSGPVEGGTLVFIFGNGFVQGAKVRFFGTFSPEVIYISSTELHATTPARRNKGTFSVTVVNPDGQTFSSANKFTYD